MPRLLITIESKDRSAMLALAQKHRIEIVRHTARELPDDAGFCVDAVVEREEIALLQALGYRVTIMDDPSSRGRDYRAFVGRGDRFLTRDNAPDKYMNVNEIESALESYASTFPALITRFALPHQTWEGRTCHAVKLSAPSTAPRVAIYLIAGVHAREWACPDALTNIVDQLARAYSLNTGVACGGWSISAAQVKAILENLELIVFPQVNPDGRHESLTGDMWWRKNRRPAPADAPNAIGVDVNRNFDFLWDYARYFHPDVMDANTQDNIANSKNPGDSTYIGPAVMSEPENKNVLSVLDLYGNIRYFIDLHSYSELVLYDWGDDNEQTSDPNMTFRNPAYDGLRGKAGDAAYSEYISPRDLVRRIQLAGRIKTAIAAVRGRPYTVKQSFGLYPTAGTSTDALAARCFGRPGAETIDAFCIECGRTFFPDESERAQIIEEMTAGVLEFCLAVLEQPADLYLRDSLADTGAEPTPDGGLSRSPDIHHFRDPLVDPQAVLGSQAAKLRDDLFEPIEFGQDNSLYIRLQNRGFKSAAAEVDLYWSRPSTLPTPSSWKLIGSLSVPAVPAGQMTVAGPLTWPSADIPAIGHYCLVAVLGTPGDPKPDLHAVHTLDQFVQLVRESNNVVWKNFEVDDRFAGTMSRLDFTICGWTNSAMTGDLKLDLSSLQIAAQQTAGGHELGRVTKRINVGAFPYVGNARTCELHKANCTWAAQVSAHNKLAFKEIDAALRRGYNGCHTCLPDLDTGLVRR